MHQAREQELIPGMGQGRAQVLGSLRECFPGECATYNMHQPRPGAAVKPLRLMHSLTMTHCCAEQALAWGWTMSSHNLQL